MKKFITQNCALLIVCLSTITGYSADDILQEQEEVREKIQNRNLRIHIPKRPDLYDRYHSKKSINNTWKIQIFTPFDPRASPQIASYTEKNELGNTLLTIEKKIEKEAGTMDISGSVIEPTFENPNPLERTTENVLSVNELFTTILIQDQQLLTKIQKSV